MSRSRNGKNGLHKVGVMRTLSERGNLLQTIIDTEPEGVKLMAADGTLLQMNPAGLAMIEADSPNQVIGKSVYPLVAPEYRQTFKTAMQRVFRGNSGMLEFEIVGIKGRRRCLETHAVPLRDHKGRILALLAITRDITQRKQAEQKLQQYAELLQSLSRRLIEVQETERRNIACELHDEIGQALTDIKLGLEMSARLPAGTAKAGLKRMRGAVTDLIDRVRDLSLRLRPAMLDDLGLLPTLVWHFEKYTAQTHVQVNFNQTGLEGRRFAPDVETSVYRIVQEALTNVARHARVSEVEVEIRADQNTLGLEIKDRGVGFDVGTVPGNGVSAGLSGMRERAVTLGGQLSVESNPGLGTALRLEIPSTHNEGLNPGKARRMPRSGRLKAELPHIPQRTGQVVEGLHQKLLQK